MLKLHNHFITDSVMKNRFFGTQNEKIMSSGAVAAVT
jgi:hypothetical protein